MAESDSNSRRLHPLVKLLDSCGELRPSEHREILLRILEVDIDLLRRLPEDIVKHHDLDRRRE